MSIFEDLQILVAAPFLLAALVAGSRRGVCWIATIVADLVATGAYWRAGLPFPDAVTASADLLICVGAYRYGRWRWERTLWLLYQFSALVSISDLIVNTWLPSLRDDLLVSILLEGTNVLAFVLIGRATGFVREDRRSSSRSRSWPRVLALVSPIYRDSARK